MRSTRRLLRSTVVVLFAAALSLAGCGSAGSSNSKELTYWSLWQRKEPQAKVLQAAIKSFEKDTGIHVNVQWQGRDNITKLLAALHGGNVPDLVDQQYFSLKGALVDNGQFTDLTSAYDMKVPGEGHTVRDVIPAKYDRFTTAGDKQFMVPYEVIGYTVWLNGKSLPKVVQDPPKTWQQFTDLLAERKAAGRDPLALDGDIAGYAQYWLASALVRTLGPGGLHKLVADKDGSGWSDPKVRDAVASIASLAQKDYFMPGYTSSKWPAIQNKWAQGKADFLFMGSWAPTETSTVASQGFEYRSFNFPAMGEDATVPASVIGFAVPKPAEHADAAEKFIAYFLNKDRLSPIATKAANLTPRTDIGVPKQLTDVKRLIEANGVSEIDDGIQGDFSDYNTKVFQPLSSKVLAGDMTADQFIDKIKSGQKSYWENNG